VYLKYRWNSPPYIAWRFLDPSNGDILHLHRKTTLVVEHQILWLDVSMDDASVVYEFESVANACGEESDLLLGEFMFFANVISEVTAWHQVHD